MYRLIDIPRKFDINADFWELNFWIKFIEPYKSLYDRDTSENKVVSGKEMWCIWLECDLSYQNKIGKLNPADKRSAILAFNPDFDYKDELINKCIVAYDEHFQSEAARAFKRTIRSIENFQNEVENKMETEGVTLDEFVSLGNNRWGNKKGTATQFLDIKKKLSQLWIEMEKHKRMFEEEQGTIELYGGGKPTLVEEGGLKMIKDDD